MESPVRARMLEHFSLARDMRNWATSGNVRELQAVARELAASRAPWGLPPGSDAYLLLLQEAAGRAAEAMDPADAIRATADVARVCGDCHVATESNLGGRFRVAEPRVDDPAIRHSNYLSRTSRLLWDGLVGPSERLWQAGVEALAPAEGLPPPPSGDVSASELERSGGRLVDLARRARAFADPAARSELVAEVWLVCATCHREAGPLSPRFPASTPRLTPLPAPGSAVGVLPDGASPP